MAIKTVELVIESSTVSTPAVPRDLKSLIGEPRRPQRRFVIETTEGLVRVVTYLDACRAVA